MARATVTGTRTGAAATRIIAALATAVLVSAMVASEAPAAPVACPVQDITFSGDTVYSEGLSWSDRQRKFFVGSMYHGTLGTVTSDGVYTPLVTDTRLVSTLGVRVDDKHNILWVANVDIGVSERSNPDTQGKLSAVAAYDATSGRSLAYIDLASLGDGPHLANDVAVDSAGNAYVTDSFAPVIYRIDGRFRASVFARSPMFVGGEGPFNLNGIAWHKGGYLLVGKHNSGELLRVELSEPTHVERVALPEALVGIDGITLVDDRHLVAAVNRGVPRAVELVSVDGWHSATIGRVVPSRFSRPTAAATAGKEVWVLNSRLDTLHDPKAEKTSDFLLQRFWGCEQAPGPVR